MLAGYKKATNPKDNIYGLHGICKHLGSGLPQPNYQKSVHTIYTQATRCILKYDKSLEFLGWIDRTGLGKGLPSWVPNFTAYFTTEGPKTPPVVQGSFQATGSSEYCFSLLADEQKLKVPGRGP